MSDERRDEFVVEQLAGLRRAMSRLEAPARLEPAVMAAFSEKARRRPRFGAAWRFAAVAAGVVLLVAGIAWNWRTPSRVESPETVAVGQPRGAAGAPERLAPQPAARQVAAAAPVAKRRPRRRALPTRPADPPARDLEIATEFLALPYAPPLDPADGGQVVRVRLPRAAMRAVGIPINEDRWQERVPADVVLGQDGVARAVRFVRVAQ